MFVYAEGSGGNRTPPRQNLGQRIVAGVRRGAGAIRNFFTGRR